jgi:hypothetical protein
MALVDDSTTYSLVINSVDRIAGTNNNATYQVNWKDFLPDDFQSYKMAFSFQSSGCYYGDGSYASSGTNLGATAPILSPAATALAANTLNLANVIGLLVGQTVVSATGISSGTSITAITGNAITISTPTVATIPANTTFNFYSSANLNQATFSSARVLFFNQGRSFSYDTFNRGPSTNIGILQRDIQVSTSESNSLSCFYCQNAPRTINRPNQNLLTINIMNSYSFSGGITSYSNGVPTYSTISTNQNFLTDTNATGTVMSNDMTPYTMLVEFIPIASTQIAKRVNIL